MLYYIDPVAGNDSNAGTFASPWKTIGKANNTLVAGDTVYLRGGNYGGQIIAPLNSGTAGNYITYEAYQGEIPLIDPSSLISWIIKWTSRSYIKVKGVHADGGPGYYTDAKIDVWAEYDQTDHCIIEDCDFRNCVGYSAIRMRGQSQYNEIRNSTMMYVGWWDKFPYTGVHDDTGSGIFIDVGCHHNLIEDNTFSKAGHDLMRDEGSYNVIRRNHWSNTFEIYSGPSFTFKNGDIQAGDAVGNRSFSMKGSSFRCLVEDNWITDVGEAVDNNEGGQCKIGGISNIIRRNVFIDGKTQGMAFASVVGSTLPNASKNKVYNNNVYNCRGGAVHISSNASSWNAPVDNVYKNNIIYQTRTDPDSWDVDFVFETNLQGWYGDAFVGAEVAYNCIAYDASATNQKVKSFHGIQTLSYMESNYSSVFHDNVQANPQWVSSDPTVASDFELAVGSPCLEAGGNLTTAVGAGSASTSLTVDDASYFCDGFGIVDADYIQIGNGSSVQITSINYNTNVITLASARTWSNGDGVNLPYAGSAPNIGISSAMPIGVTIPPGSVTLTGYPPEFAPQSSASVTIPVGSVVITGNLCYPSASNIVSSSNNNGTRRSLHKATGVKKSWLR